MAGGTNRWVRVGLGIAFCGLLLVAAWGAALLLLPRAPEGAERLFRITPGETFGQVEQRLVAEGLVRRGTPLRLWARLTGRERAIRHGTYRLSSGASPATILESLTTGRIVLRRLPVKVYAVGMVGHQQDLLALGPAIEVHGPLADQVHHTPRLGRVKIDAP